MYLPGGDWRPPSPAPYCYLLGLYLGDGCIGTSASHSPQLTLTLDAQYSKIIDAAAEAMQTSMPEANVGTCRGAGMIKIYSSHPAWLEAFPQHGPGRKHTRVIELVDWQQALTHEYPQELVRGLIHSDGSRARIDSRPSSRAAASRSTHMSGTSSPTTRRTSEGSSATTATFWESAGLNRASRTSRLRTANR